MSDNLRTFAKNLQAMKRTLLLFVVLVLGVSGLRAQRFEWAKGYSSSQEGNLIIGSVTDSVGNLYILGHFRNDASWDGGSHLLPIAPYGPYTNVHNVLIAKITPNGTMAWKKVLHANNGIGADAWDIKSVGDTAFACLVRVTLPNEEHYCYYLDTLLNGWGDYPIPNGDMGSTDRTALITFDFEGNVLEQHFLTLTYLDNTGMDIKHDDWYFNNGSLLYISFDIDNEGNIYFCRSAMDASDGIHFPWQGTISGIKYWVDGRVVGTSTTYNRPMYWFPQLLKFSPHMDTLLASRYLVQSCDSVDYQTDRLYMKLDRDGNPYVVGTLSQFGRDSNQFVLDSSRNLFMHHSPANLQIPFLIKTNSSLQPIANVFMEDSVIRPNLANSSTNFWDIDFDKDSNLLFLTACTGRGAYGDTTNSYSILKCQGIPLLNLKNDAFFMAFRIQDDTLAFYSYGCAPSEIASDLIKRGHTNNNLACFNNRLFFQLTYYGGINFPGEHIHLSNMYASSLGLISFDYQGHVVEGKSYATPSSNYNQPGVISLQDSVLYLSNYLATEAIFGNIHVPSYGSNACIAKYVDTSFLTPYIYVPDTDSIDLPEVEPDLLYVYPNPAHGELFLSVGDEQITGVYLTTLMGQRKPVLFSNGIVSLSGFPAGMYFIEVTTNKNKYHKKIIVL